MSCWLALQGALVTVRKPCERVVTGAQAGSVQALQTMQADHHMHRGLGCRKPAVADTATASHAVRELTAQAPSVPQAFPHHRDINTTLSTAAETGSGLCSHRSLGPTPLALLITAQVAWARSHRGAQQSGCSVRLSGLPAAAALPPAHCDGAPGAALQRRAGGAAHGGGVAQRGVHLPRWPRLPELRGQRCEGAPRGRRRCCLQLHLLAVPA